MPDLIYYQEREAEIYDLEYAWKNDDVEFWKTLAHEYAGNDGQVLELACGTGRLLLPLAESGIRITGLDQSPWMLKRAREKLANASDEIRARVTLHEGDMRAFVLHQKYNLIYVPFNSFLILTETADQLAVFNAVRQHLAPGGVFGLDIFVPDVMSFVFFTASGSVSQASGRLPNVLSGQSNALQATPVRFGRMNTTVLTDTFLPVVALDDLVGPTPTETPTPTATPTPFCYGETYDVNNDWSDGCEQTDNPLGNHTQVAAVALSSQNCNDAILSHFTGRLLSDQRVHASPVITGFVALTGSAPDYVSVVGTGGLSCVNDLSVKVDTTGGSASTCYKLSVITDKGIYTANFTENGTQTLTQSSGAYSDNTTIYFELEKICNLPVIEAVDYTVTFHL